MAKVWWVGIGALVWVLWNAAGEAPEQPTAVQRTTAPLQVAQPLPTAGYVATPAASQVPRLVAADASTYLFVSGNRVRVRSGPDTSSRIIGHLDVGDRVRLHGTNGNWTEVTSSLGRGWVSSQYLSSQRIPPAAVAPTPAQRSVAAPNSRQVQDARTEIIQQSIASYSGSCPCPYNTDRAGRRCGARSAWSRPGGYRPMCYDSDVSEARLQTYFARRR